MFKWKQVWHSSEVKGAERKKDNSNNRCEAKRLKECALAWIYFLHTHILSPPEDVIHVLNGYILALEYIFYVSILDLVIFKNWESFFLGGGGVIGKETLRGTNKSRQLQSCSRPFALHNPTFWWRLMLSLCSLFFLQCLNFFPLPGSNDRGHIVLSYLSVCLFFCSSVCWYR